MLELYWLPAMEEARQVTLAPFKRALFSRADAQSSLLPTPSPFPTPLFPRSARRSVALPRVRLCWLCVRVRGVRASQSAALLRLTQRLYSRTWGAAARGFRLATAAAAQPQLAIYVDRTSLRLPGACLLHLLEGVPCTIKVRRALPLSRSLRWPTDALTALRFSASKI
eukprot:5983915-Pleurochrysis_carterae.AAC.2